MQFRICKYSCMALMMGQHGTVFHLESIPDLKERVKKTIEKTSPHLLWSKRIQLLDVEDESAGYPQPKVRYDVIYVGAAAAEIPRALIDQLASGGRLVMPIGPKDGHQQLIQIDKTLDGKIEKKTPIPVIYGYLDSPRTTTKINAIETREEKCTNNKSTSNLSNECLNNTISKKIQSQSSTKILNTSLTKPVQNHFNNNCMKDHLTQTITYTLETKTDETDAQPSVKDPEKNAVKIFQELQTIITKLEDAQEKSRSDSNSESRISHEMMKTQSMNMQNITSPIKPVQNHSNNCMKDELLSMTKKKSEIKIDEADAQSSIKEPEENLHKTLRTLTKKLELESKDDLEKVQKIEHTQEKSTSDSSSEIHIFYEIMKTQSSIINELSKDVKIIREENELLSKRIKELNGKKQGPLSYVARNHEATVRWFFILIGVLAIIVLDSYHTFIKKL